MSPWLFIPLLYLASLLQTWFTPRWEAFQTAPNLLVMVAFLWLTQSPSRRGLLLAALAGLVSDLNATTPLGLGVATFVCAAYAVVSIRQRVSLDSFVAQLAVVWFAAATITLAQGMFIKYSGTAPIFFGALVQRSLLVGVYTMIVAVPVLIFLFQRNTPQKQFA